LYRIDHIVGFFRIWAIPYGLSAKDGHFVPSDSAKWIDHGQRLMLMMLDRCDMLPIGEDLGVVPPEARACLHALGICGTKVMRWERKWKEDKNFIRIEDYPVDSLSTVSTHDSETLQLWWQNNPEDANLFARFKGWSYNSVLSRGHQYEMLWDSHHSASLFHINLLQEYLALIPGMTWPLLEDERINVPGVCSDRNWTYRFKPSIEELVTNQTLQHLLKELIL
jgi:4-alpha-glucanotransferase